MKIFENEVALWVYT